MKDSSLVETARRLGHSLNVGEQVFEPGWVQSDDLGVLQGRFAVDELHHVIVFDGADIALGLGDDQIRRERGQ